MNYFGAVIDPVYFPHLEVIGDIGNAIWQLCESIKDSPPSWDTRCRSSSPSAQPGLWGGQCGLLSRLPHTLRHDMDQAFVLGFPLLLCTPCTPCQACSAKAGALRVMAAGGLHLLGGACRRRQCEGVVRRYFAYLSRQMALHMTQGTDDCTLPMAPPRLVALIRHAMPEDGIVCLDNGLYKVSTQ